MKKKIVQGHIQVQKQEKDIDSKSRHPLGWRIRESFIGGRFLMHLEEGLLQNLRKEWHGKRDLSLTDHFTDHF
jgi:hypothetical protein